MSILSITFHSIAQQIAHWEIFLHRNIQSWVQNLHQLEQWYLSEIESEMIQEGKNYNLLLFFQNNQARENYLTNEFPKLFHQIHEEFGTEIMLFESKLNPIPREL